MVDSDYTHLAIIADRSGSMTPIQKDMNGGLQELLKTQSELPGKLLIDITTFDGFVEHIAENASYEDISFPIIYPRGSTALLDAVGKTVNSLGERFSKMEEEERPGKVIVVIVTDGAENSSREYSNRQVRELVERQQNEYNWEFVFLGANIDSFAVAGAWGIARGSTITYATNSESVNNLSGLASNYLTTVRTVGSAAFSDADREKLLRSSSTS